MPLANPSGFVKNKREEFHLNGKFVDINRDFPYKQSSCFLTAAARSVNYIYQQHLILAAITFHGGAFSLSYPWGSPNHAYQENYKMRKSYESPD